MAYRDSGESFIGQKFNKWTVLEPTRNGSHQLCFICRCDCGNIRTIVKRGLTHGTSKSCGKCKENELRGKRFGKLTVIGKHGSDEHGTIIRLCLCDCGNIRLTKDTFTNPRTYPKSCIPCSLKRQSARLTKPNNLSAKRNVFYTYKTGAEKRGYEFCLTEEQLWSIASKDCYYCGKPPSNKCRKANSVFIYNGVDRLDNSLGYYVGNCVPCCCACNKAKSTSDADDFYDWVKSVFYNLKSKGLIIE